MEKIIFEALIFVVSEHMATFEARVKKVTTVSSSFNIYFCFKHLLPVIFLPVYFFQASKQTKRK